METIIIVLIVAAAAFYIIWRVANAAGGKSTCERLSGSPCNGCNRALTCSGDPKDIARRTWGR